MAFWHIENHPSLRLAVITDSGAGITYGDLLEYVQQIEQRISRGDLIFILCSNNLATLAGYLACLRSGAVALMLDVNIESSRYLELIQIYQPAYIWCPESYSKESSVFTLVDYSLCATDAIPFSVHSDLALLVTTSGSTGSPKLVRLSHTNLQSNACSISEYLHLSSSERPFVHLPLNYVFGLSVVNSHLLKGATLILTQYSLMQREFWHQLAEHKATSLSGVPYTFEMLMRLRFNQNNYPSLMTLTQAGGKLVPHLHQHFAAYAQQQKMSFIVMYGAAEATARMAWLPAEYTSDKQGAIGIAIPSGELSLVDENGVSVTQPGVRGELIYRGPNVMLGYATQGSDLSKGDELKGVFQTGDIAFRDEEGFFTLVGRKKRFLKIFGNRLGLDELETLLREHLPDYEIACSGEDDKLSIFIIDESIAERIKQYVVRLTKFHPSAIVIRLIAVMPRTASGKIQYEKLSDVTN
ncbi:AMP-binding protein [Pantoea sp. Acro-805]|uniref:AMP-binding protein n=1 Tax=Candidatus Pantoea formicae TaxID=2608355 RepID=A0ABX0QYS7_9GAMM|nr:AMP-binding protein [Pantoea formicae]MDF7651464.1 AMP-binding protein [Erwiniaceae bacterium L1_54_3]NIF00790.1 AMP-binding protein [Pantoea formicae]